MRRTAAEVFELFLLAGNSVPKIALYPIMLLIFGMACGQDRLRRDPRRPTGDDLRPHRLLQRRLLSRDEGAQRRTDIVARVGVAWVELVRGFRASRAHEVLNLNNAMTGLNVPLERRHASFNPAPRSERTLSVFGVSSLASPSLATFPFFINRSTSASRLSASGRSGAGADHMV